MTSLAASARTNFYIARQQFKSFFIKPTKSLEIAIYDAKYKDHRITTLPRHTEDEIKQAEVYFGSERTKIKFLETDYGYYVQPTQRHYKLQFEMFFGFGCGNMGYDPNRTIFVPKF